MTGRPSQLEPPPEEGSRGRVEGKGRGPEPRGRVEWEADRGVTVSLSIIRAAGPERDFYDKKAGWSRWALFALSLKLGN